MKRLTNGGVESVGRVGNWRGEGFWRKWRGGRGGRGGGEGCLGGDGAGRGLGLRRGGSRDWDESARTIYRRLIKHLFGKIGEGKGQWSRMVTFACHYPAADGNGQNELPG